MKRLSFRLIYPLIILANRLGYLSYKWVNVGIAAWNPQYFDELWHYRWFGDRIDELPPSVGLCGLRFTTCVTEGLIVFSNRDVWETIRFSRDPHDKHQMLWYCEHDGHVPACHIVAAYQWVEAVFGGSHEFKLNPISRRPVGVL